LARVAVVVCWLTNTSPVSLALLALASGISKIRRAGIGGGNTGSGWTPRRRGGGIEIIESGSNIGFLTPGPHVGGGLKRMIGSTGPEAGSVDDADGGSVAGRITV